MRPPVIFINNLVFRFAIVGGIFNVLFAGLPMLFVLVDEQLLRVSMIPGLFYDSKWYDL